MFDGGAVEHGAHGAQTVVSQWSVVIGGPSTSLRMTDGGRVYAMAAVTNSCASVCICFKWSRPLKDSA